MCSCLDGTARVNETVPSLPCMGELLGSYSTFSEGNKYQHELV